MKRICAWCGRDMGLVDTALYPESTVTHGICPSCARKYFHEPKRSLRNFFMRLMVPIFHLVKT